MPLEILHRAAPCRNVPVTFTLDLKSMTALTRPDLLQWAESSVAFYGLAMERIGTVVLAQLYAMQATRTFVSVR